MSPVNTRCKLCGEIRILCKSHIIPEFFFRPLYDEKHRLWRITTAPDEATIIRQQGIYERMLCTDCEQRINDYEKHAKKLFFDDMEYYSTGNPNEIKIVKLNYSKFKLFQLSVLWRASVATDPTFSEVRLGDHEDRIRGMLLHRDPGEPHVYGCIVFGLHTEELGVFKAIIQPERGRVDGHISYRFVFGSCGWVFLVSGHTEKFERRKYFIAKDGTVLMKVLPAREVPFIMSMVKTLAKPGKLRQ